MKNKEYNNIKIQYPSSKEIEYYMRKWDSQENYVHQEKALDKLFFKLCPENKDINDVLLKTVALNDCYSTQIFSVYTVANHIITISNIDKRIKDGDETLVEEIQTVTINGKEKNFYSFATKYCSHHNPSAFPIYDSYVSDMLYFFSKRDNFFKFTKVSLRNYRIFKKTISSFMNFYSLNQYSVKDIDKYLWQIGKENFAKFNT